MGSVPVFAQLVQKWGRTPFLRAGRRRRRSALHHECEHGARTRAEREQHDDPPDPLLRALGRIDIGLRARGIHVRLRLRILQLTDVIDVHDYSNSLARHGVATPVKPKVVGEFGGIALPVPGHTWTQGWGYQTVRDPEGLLRRVRSQTTQLFEAPNLSGFVYTQLTDVETEANGLLTYDREVIKLDLDAAAEANRGEAKPVAEAARTVILPTSEKTPQTWRYTTDKPADDWFKADFDDSVWKSGPGGFGTKNTPGATVRTTWNSADIWIRREFDVKDAVSSPLLMMHHDEDAEVYINGVLAAKAPGYVSEYEEFDLSPQAKAGIKTGKNTIAIHCHQTTGGQYIDAGIVDSK